MAHDGALRDVDIPIERSGDGNYIYEPGWEYTLCERHFLKSPRMQPAYAKDVVQPPRWLWKLDKRV